jgi:hypothetical protein
MSDDNHLTVHVIWLRFKRIRRDNNNLVPSLRQMDRQLVNVVLYSTHIWKEEVGDHTVSQFSRII